jgi:hypothetical protein
MRTLTKKQLIIAASLGFAVGSVGLTLIVNSVNALGRVTGLWNRRPITSQNIAHIEIGQKHALVVTSTEDGKEYRIYLR